MLFSATSSFDHRNWDVDRLKNCSFPRERFISDPLRIERTGIFSRYSFPLLFRVKKKKAIRIFPDVRQEKKGEERWLQIGETGDSKGVLNCGVSFLFGSSLQFFTKKTNLSETVAIFPRAYNSLYGTMWKWIQGKLHEHCQPVGKPELTKIVNGCELILFTCIIWFEKDCEKTFRDLELLAAWNSTQSIAETEFPSLLFPFSTYWIESFMKYFLTSFLRMRIFCIQSLFDQRESTLSIEVTK